MMIKNNKKYIFFGILKSHTIEHNKYFILQLCLMIKESPYMLQ